MKRISPGKNQPDWRVTVTCKEEWATGCAAVFEVGREDVFVEKERMFGRSMPCVYCFCPDCGERIKIGDARPFQVFLPNLEAFTLTNPEIVSKAEESMLETTKAYAANPRNDDSAGRGG